jgi:hypothetical protein
VTGFHLPEHGDAVRSWLLINNRMMIWTDKYQIRVFITLAFVKWFVSARTLTAIGNDVRHLPDDRVAIAFLTQLD